MRRTPDTATSTDLPSWWAAHAPQVPLGHELHGIAASAMSAARSGRSRAELVTTLELLGDLGADFDTQAAALVAQAPLPAASMTPAVAQLVHGVVDAEKVWALHATHGVAGSAEGLRRLLLAIVRDLRVVFVLLAQMLARLRHADQLAEPDRLALARLAMDLHAPLANRLGIWQIKWEIEDLAFRHAEPDIYRKVAKLLDERRSDREGYIARATSALETELARAGIEADIKGRPKHIYSIWKKMQRKGNEFEELHDLRALRVLVGDVADCYATLGVVHALWPPVPSEFDDYIARPKGNRYQSLHTAVQGPDGRALEIQIRTHEMHAHAELGVAAHWRYKEGGGGDAAFERRIAWMRQLIDARSGTEEPGALIAALGSELADERVYLLTPRGEVLDLAHGATVLDFAYAVHTEVGHRCRGAKVDGRIVPLTHQPRSGDTIEVLTAKQGEPKRDWLVADRGYLNTARAREKVRAWFRKIDTERNLAAGRDLLEREFRRLGLPYANLDRLAVHLKLKNVDELLLAVALGDITGGHAARALHEFSLPQTAATGTQIADSLPIPTARATDARGGAGSRVVIEGVGNLLTLLARCCQPVAGDAIVGFLTRARGVSVHRAGCRSFAALAARDESRVVEVAWGRSGGRDFAVDILVRAYDRRGLLKDVSAAISAADVRVVAATTRGQGDSGEAQLEFTLRVGDFAQLSSLLHRIASLPNVLDVRRVGAAPAASPDPPPKPRKTRKVR